MAKALLIALVENSHDAIASKNLDGIVTSWNRSAERLFGYTAEEMIGQPIAILAAPGRESEMPMILERIRRGERVENYDTVRKRKDGTLIEVSLTVSLSATRPDGSSAPPRSPTTSPSGAGQSRSASGALPSCSTG